jgi:hypothetical protein
LFLPLLSSVELPLIATDCIHWAHKGAIDYVRAVMLSDALVVVERSEQVESGLRASHPADRYRAVERDHWVWRSRSQDEIPAYPHHRPDCTLAATLNVSRTPKLEPDQPIKRPGT